MGFFDDPQASGALSGAGSGALTGFAVGGPVGALVGGLGGGLLGLFGGGAQKKQEQNLADARARLQEAARQSYAQRMQDLDRGMAYFQPVNADLQRLYGQGAAIPQQTYAPKPLDPRVFAGAQAAVGQAPQQPPGLWGAFNQASGANGGGGGPGAAGTLIKKFKGG